MISLKLRRDVKQVPSYKIGTKPMKFTFIFKDLGKCIKDSTVEAALVYVSKTYETQNISFVFKHDREMGKLTRPKVRFLLV